MVKIFIAEDESYFRKGLAFVIGELGSDFLVSGEAADGLEALRLIEQNTPDIVITDIKMPHIDGLNLIKLLCEKYPRVKIIALSGFDDYELVRQAMKNGALDYLLKPIDEEQLLRLLKKVRSDILDENEHMKTELYLKQKLKESIPLISDQLAREIICKYSRPFEEYAIQWRHLHDIELRKGMYQIIIVSIDNNKFLASQNEKELCMLNSLIVRIISEESTSRLTDYLSFQDDDALAIACYISENIDIVRKIAGEIFTNLVNFTELRFTISVGPPERDLSQLRNSMVIARENLKYRFYGNTSSIVYFDDFHKNFMDMKPEGLVEGFECFIGNCLETFNYKRISSVFDDLRNKIRELFIKQEIALNLLVDIFMAVQIKYPKFRKAIESARGNVISYETAVKLFDTLDEAIEYTIGIYTAAAQSMEHVPGKKDGNTVQQVKKYVLANYNQMITLNKAAQVAHINANYLSDLFKSQTGEGFIGFVTRVRIDKAKELLRSSVVKAYEAGEAVGYEDPAYFSKVFKKLVGVSPNDYRKLI